MQIIGIVLGLSIILFFIGLILWAMFMEKQEYNKGICKCCGKPLRHFDTDSQGGRLYTCPNYCCLISVSYDFVDKPNRRNSNDGR